MVITIQDNGALNLINTNQKLKKLDLRGNKITDKEHVHKIV